MAETTRIDVSIENKQAPEPPSAKKHPNTCPQCGSHYRDDELAANLRVCSHCGHHFPVKAHERIAQIADEGSFSEEAADLRSADPLKFFDLRAYNERLAEAEVATGLGDALVIGSATIEDLRCELAVMDFSFMGGSMGSVTGEKFARACESAADCRRAADLDLGLGRRSHAGGNPGADAAAEDRRRRRRAARSRVCADLGDGASRRRAACSRASRASATSCSRSQAR